MSNFHIPRWEELPSLNLYIDQVVTLVEDYLKNLIYITEDENKIITKTMINNYVKHGILNPPINKKYNKSHIAFLIVICILKQVYSINAINALIKIALETSGIELSYDKFCVLVEKAVDSVFNKTHFSYDEKMTYERYILKNVVLSFASKLYVQKAIMDIYK